MMVFLTTSGPGEDSRIMVLLTTSGPGDDSRMMVFLMISSRGDELRRWRDRVEWDRCREGEPDRTLSTLSSSQSRTDRGASEIGTVVTFFSIVSSKPTSMVGDLTRTAS